MTCARVNQVPREVWEPVAQAVAFVHGITVKQMLYEGRAYKYTIPRARFWYVLRSFIPRYTLTAIGNITGHDHSTVARPQDQRAQTPQDETPARPPGL
jgi:chromosomal replication initiation ATPase DnaA